MDPDPKKQAFLDHLENLLLSRRKISRQQAELCALYARLNGWITHRERQTKGEKRAELPAQDELPGNKYGLDAYRLHSERES